MAYLKSLFSNRYIFILYFTAIIGLVILPLNSSGELNNTAILRFRADYFLHALLFLPWAFFRPAFRIKPGWWLLWGLLFAAGSEGLQYFLPYRAWNVNDLVANAVGIFLGFILWLLYVAIRKQIKIA
ncbi:VanZ like family protein [Tangfeifania diversioriginum]|uniref:VanZ like family protein n=1 Tax=Tangfeifania diversioriginum TaxID=1168035 RepID=A0A1M6NN31_9BACT|nr:VanZ family protein [Tangfeifania diversioriginum]SHJ97093.1 VanZ like family protein [Tangfeifania diversioriginum]